MRQPSVINVETRAINRIDFANVGVVRVIVQVLVECAQHRNAGAQHVHRMRIFRQKPQHFRDWAGQLALAGNLLCEFPQLLRTWQFAIEQQVSDLLESGLLGHLMNVVAPIHQPGGGIDPADRRFTGDYPGQSRAVFWFCFSTHVVR